MNYQNFSGNQLGANQVQGGYKPIATMDTFINTTMEGTRQVLRTVNSIRNDVINALDANKKCIENASRKNKKLVGKPSIMMDGNGQYSIAQMYEDYSFGGVPLFGNVSGECNVYQLSFFKLCRSPRKYVMLVFTNGGKRVICDKEKVTGTNLYRWFLEAGVMFCRDVNGRLINEALFDYFAPKIANARNIAQMDGMAGWCQKEWRYTEKLQTVIPKGMPALPIQDKHFITECHGKELLETFLEGIGSIADKGYRIIILETLVSGVLASLFQEEGIYSNHFLNFVLVDGMDKELFCRLYQVFNRGIWEIQEADVRSKLISDHIRTINDEVLIVHVASEKDSYACKKTERNLRDIVNKICRRDCSSLNIPWKVNASLIVLNEYVSDLDSAINIVADQNVFTPQLVEMLRGNAVDAFLYELVKYVEEHMVEVRAAIKRGAAQMEGNRNLVLLKTIWKILIEFAQDRKIDLAVILGVVGNPDWEVMWRCLTDRQEMDEKMIAAVRTSMREFYVQEKYYGCKYLVKCCYYNEEYFWIPVSVFKEIMKNNKISYNKYRLVLAKWKQQKLVLPDESGLTYKLRVSEVPIQTYRFRKTLFNKELEVPIEELGKGEEDEKAEREKHIYVVHHPQSSAHYKK